MELKGKIRAERSIQRTAYAGADADFCVWQRVVG